MIPHHQAGLSDQILANTHVELLLRGQEPLGFAYSGRSLTRISPALTPSTSPSATPASAPCRTSAFTASAGCPWRGVHVLLAGSGFGRLYEIPYRGLKLPRFLPLSGAFAGGVGPICRR